MRVVTKFISRRTKNLAVRLDSVTNLSDTDIYYFYDGTLKEEIQEIFKQKGTPKYVVNDHMTKFDYGPTSSNFFGFPLILENQAALFVETVLPDVLKTDYCFNFMTNKKQINRFLLIKLVEFFNLKDYDYTWSGEGSTENLTVILKELDQLDTEWNNEQFRVFLLDSIKISKKFIPFPEGRHRIDVTYTQEKVPTTFYGGNKWTWDNILSNMFNNSAISLISESLSYQRAAIFTEKTLYSILGLTFPIWIGGAWHASELEKIGIDSFSDIIDHSYENCDTLIERCYRAFSDNFDLLNNKELASSLREECYPRLLKNRDFVLNGGLTTAIDKKLLSLPTDLQETLIPFINTTWHRHTNKAHTIGNEAILQLITKNQ